jgi:hypothetical protein
MQSDANEATRLKAGLADSLNFWLAGGIHESQDAAVRLSADNSTKKTTLSLSEVG